ncbi:transposase [Streptomyces sp. NPDC005799]|uniref:transposase n=1 Tax=Streptomyces sp. NPDC005799 TaxID=3154678 RepID=UPI0033E4F720
MATAVGISGRVVAPQTGVWQAGPAQAAAAPGRPATGAGSGRRGAGRRVQGAEIMERHVDSAVREGVGTRPWIVGDDLWVLIEPLLPPWPEKAPVPRPVADRLCLQGILYVLHNDLAWQLLPLELGFGSGQTCWRRLERWQLAGGLRPTAPHPARRAERGRRTRLVPRVRGWQRLTCSSGFSPRSKSTLARCSIGAQSGSGKDTRRSTHGLTQSDGVLAGGRSELAAVFAAEL